MGDKRLRLGAHSGGCSLAVERDDDQNCAAKVSSITAVAGRRRNKRRVIGDVLACLTQKQRDCRARVCRYTSSIVSKPSTACNLIEYNIVDGGFQNGCVMTK